MNSMDRGVRGAAMREALQSLKQAGKKRGDNAEAREARIRLYEERVGKVNIFTGVAYNDATDMINVEDDE